jgi:hypothetical protein
VSKLSQSEEQVIVKHVLQTMSLTVAFDIICRRSFGIICRQRARRPPPGQSAQPGRPPRNPRRIPSKCSLRGPELCSVSVSQDYPKALRPALTPNRGKRATPNNSTRYTQASRAQLSCTRPDLGPPTANRSRWDKVGSSFRNRCLPRSAWMENTDRSLHAFAIGRRFSKGDPGHDRLPALPSPLQRSRPHF